MSVRENRNNKQPKCTKYVLMPSAYLSPTFLGTVERLWTRHRCYSRVIISRFIEIALLTLSVATIPPIRYHKRTQHPPCSLEKYEKTFAKTGNCIVRDPPPYAISASRACAYRSTRHTQSVPKSHLSGVLERLEHARTPY